MALKSKGPFTIGTCLVLTAAVGTRPAECQGASQLAWLPAVPAQGSLVLLGVRAPTDGSVRSVQGALAGQTLHFELRDGWFRAIGGIPLSARGHIPAHLVIERTSGAHVRVTRSLPVAARHAPSERLQTDPGFVQPPASVAPRIRAEQALVRGLKRGTQGRPRLWDGPFVPPRPGPVTDVFGVGRVFNGRLRSRHLGADFGGDVGDSVLAANRGVVVYTGDLYFNGTTVFLDHGAGLLSAYLHLSRILVAPGDTVATGQLIGLVGATGRVTGPHLHWFASYGDVTVDPVDLLHLDLDAAFP
jgi:murein DD-endopeptidase MepM/ murein hydrolase activator NlpD